MAIWEWIKDGQGGGFYVTDCVLCGGTFSSPTIENVCQRCMRPETGVERFMRWLRAAIS